MLKRALFAASLLLSASAEAQYSVSVSQPVATNYLPFNNNWVAETFRATEADVAGGGFRVSWECSTFVGFPSQCLANGGVIAQATGSVSLWSGDPSQGGSVKLASGVVQASLQAFQRPFVDAFWSPVSVTVGQLYWLTFSPMTYTAGSNFTGPINVQYALPGGIDPYPNGQPFNGGVNETDAYGINGLALRNEQDFPFRVWSTVPEPSTYAMMSIGLALLGFAAKRRRRTM